MANEPSAIARPCPGLRPRAMRVHGCWYPVQGHVCRVLVPAAEIDWHSLTCVTSTDVPTGPGSVRMGSSPDLSGSWLCARPAPVAPTVWTSHSRRERLGAWENTTTREQTHILVCNDAAGHSHVGGRQVASSQCFGATAVRPRACVKRDVAGDLRVRDDRGVGAGAGQRSGRQAHRCGHGECVRELAPCPAVPAPCCAVTHAVV